jgi:hypothetical protein
MAAAPPPDRPLPPTPKKPAKYTLAGTPDWQSMRNKSKPITTFSLRERDFIKEALTAEFDPNLTGTKVIYVAPDDGSDHMSLISNDDKEGEAPGGSRAGTGQGGGRFKRIAKRFYPAKVVGRAKAVGSAIRHPMVTSRKMNLFQQKKSASGQGKGKGLGLVSNRLSASVTDLAGDGFVGLKRSVTLTEGSADSAANGNGMCLLSLT